MTARQPMEVKEALSLVKHEQIKTEVAIIQAKLLMAEARRRWGIRAESPRGGAAALYHLLQHGDGASQLRQLEVGNEMITEDQGAWIPARLVECTTADSTEQVWKCNRSSHKVVQEYKQTFIQEQHNQGVIRGDNAQLDLNDPRVKMVRLSGQRTSALIKSLQWKHSVVIPGRT